MKKILLCCLLGLLSLLAGCGYHAMGHATRLPANIRTIAIPGFKNQTQTYRVEQILTTQVVREFISRTKFQVVNSAADTSGPRRRSAGVALIDFLLLLSFNITSSIGFWFCGASDWSESLSPLGPSRTTLGVRWLNGSQRVSFAIVCV